jgi:hypothetical protein
MLNYKKCFLLTMLITSLSLNAMNLGEHDARLASDLADAARLGIVYGTMQASAQVAMQQHMANNESLSRTFVDMLKAKLVNIGAALVIGCALEAGRVGGSAALAKAYEAYLTLPISHAQKLRRQAQERQNKMEQMMDEYTKKKAQKSLHKDIQLFQDFQKNLNIKEMRKNLATLAAQIEQEQDEKRREQLTKVRIKLQNDYLNALSTQSAILKHQTEGVLLNSMNQPHLETWKEEMEQAQRMMKKAQDEMKKRALQAAAQQAITPAVA